METWSFTKLRFLRGAALANSFPHTSIRAPRPATNQDARPRHGETMPPEDSITRDATERDRSSDRATETVQKDLSRGLWDDIRESATSVVNRAERAVREAASSVVDMTIGNIYASTFDVSPRATHGDSAASESPASRPAGSQVAAGRDGQENHRSASSGGQPQRPEAAVPERTATTGSASTEVVNREEMASAAEGIFDGDAEDINRLLEGRTQTERATMNTLFRQQHGVTIEQHLRSTLDGAELDRAINLLNRTDGRADDAGRIHTALIERGQLIEGRSDAVCEQDIRDTISTLNSRQLEALDQDYRRRYATGLREALVTSDALSEPTRQSLDIYLRGTDRRTDADTLRLADIALRARDTNMFQAAFTNASQQARTSFMSNGGEQRLQAAFGRALPSAVEEFAGDFAPFLETVVEAATRTRQNEMMTHGGLTDVDRMRDYVLHGRLSTATQVRDNTSVLGDNERAIETSLRTMSQEDRDAYFRGRDLANRAGGESGLSQEQRRDVATYRQIHSALEGAGNSTEIARWEDMIRTRDGGLVSRLMTHRGSIYDDRLDDVIRDIENIGEQDWQRLRQDPTYRREIEDALGTFLDGDELTRCTEVLNRQANAESYEAARQAGRRSVVEAISDATGGVLTDTRERHIVEALSNMTEAEQRRYRENADFRRQLDQSVSAALEEGPELEAARRVLARVENGQAPTIDIISRLNLRAAEQNESNRLTTAAVMAGAVVMAPITMGGSMVAAGAYLSDQAGNDGQGLAAASSALLGASETTTATIRDVQEAFRQDPGLRQRILHPTTEADRQFSQQFNTALRRTMSASDYEQYARPLIETGTLALETRAEMSRGLIDDNERRTYQDIVSATDSERQRIVNDQQYQDQVLGHLSADERAIAVNAARQGEMRPEDLIRSYMVGNGTEVEDLQAALRNLTPEQREQVRSEYARKYHEDLTVSLLDELGGQDLREALRSAVREPDSAREAFNRTRGEHYESRGGLGRMIVDHAWDGTGHMADDALYQYAGAMADVSSRFEELPVERRRELEENLRNALDMYVESEGAVANAIVDAAIAVVAVGGAVFTDGISLSLLAATGFGAALFKVGARAAIMGGDYDFSSMAGLDAATGFVDGALSMVGPGEVAAMLRVGERAAQTAATTIVREGGERLLREGAQEVLQRSVTRAVRDSVTSGTYRVSEETVNRIMGQVSREGLDTATQTELRNLIRNTVAQSVQREGRAALEATATRYALNMAGGAAGGGGSGMIRGFSEWDNSRSFAENLEMVGRTTLTSAAIGAGGAATFTAVFDAASPVVARIRDHFRLRPGQELSQPQLQEAARLTGVPDARLRETPQGDLVLEGTPARSPAEDTGDALRGGARQRESSPALSRASSETSDTAASASRDTLVDAAPPAGMEEPAVRVSPIRVIGDEPVVTRPIHSIVDSHRTPDAIAASNRFTRNHRIDERLPDGFQYVERRRYIDADGVVSGRDRMLHSVVVDRQTDPVLSSAIGTARQRYAHLPPAQRAEALQNYVNDLLRPSGMTEEALDSWHRSFLAAHDGHRIPLGEFIAHGQGVCSQRALLLKVLGDELGLDFRLIRGSGGADPTDINHVWTEIDLPGQGTRIFDPRQFRVGQRAEEAASHFHGSAIDSGAVRGSRDTIIDDRTFRSRDTLPDGTAAWAIGGTERASSAVGDGPAMAPPRSEGGLDHMRRPTRPNDLRSPTDGTVSARERQLLEIRESLRDGVEMDEAADVVARLRAQEDPVITIPIEHLDTILSQGSIQAQPSWTGHRLLVGTLGTPPAQFGQERFQVRVINRAILASPRATGPDRSFHGVVAFNTESMVLGRDFEVILPDGTVIGDTH